MLEKIVKPLVKTQVSLLANSEATDITLIETMKRWLSYLGVSAQIEELETVQDQIRVSLVVGKPASCDPQDWTKILTNLARQPATEASSKEIIAAINPVQQRKLARLIAYLLQIADPQQSISWDTIAPILGDLDLNEMMISELKSALKVPQSGDKLVEKFDADLAAIALPMIVKITLLDQKINQAEDQIIKALLSTIE